MFLRRLSGTHTKSSQLSVILGIYTGTGEMVLVMRFQSPVRAWVRIPSSPVNGYAWWCWPLTPVLVGQREVDSWSSAAGQPPSGAPGSMRDPVKKKEVRGPGGIPQVKGTHCLVNSQPS